MSHATSSTRRHEPRPAAELAIVTAVGAPAIALIAIAFVLMWTATPW